MIALKDRKIFGVEYYNPELNENMMYFPAADVFVNEPDYVHRYRLMSKFRDFKYVSKENLPSEYPINNVKYNEDGFCEFISIRACHCILYGDISRGLFHFLENPYLKEKLLEYDKYHGMFLKYLFDRRPYPKNIMHLNVKVYGQHYVTNVDYFELVKGLDGGTGILVYAHDDQEGRQNYTVYLDSKSSQEFRFSYKLNQ